MAFLRKTWLPLLVALAAGFVFGMLVPEPVANSVFSWNEEHEKQDEYRFINPLLSCGDGNFNHLGNAESARLEEDLQTKIDDLKAKGSITDAGLYFRELNGGPWVGVNYDVRFTPGSLLKVPLAISVYQLSESDPGLLTREIAFEGGEASADQHFTAEPLTPGTYNVEELIRRSIVESDNTAALLLAQIIGIDEVNKSYSRLGITVPTTGSDYSTSVRTYASFFRILYNATYLDRPLSEHLLAHLSEVKFDKGIVAGVPKGTTIAHKFGERSLEGEALVQLHDCGIVYHPTQPYLLCVMMRGRDFDTLASSIADISKLVYDSVK